MNRETVIIVIISMIAALVGLFKIMFDDNSGPNALKLCLSGLFIALTAVVWTSIINFKW